MGYVPIRKPREEADKVLGGRYRLSFHEEGNEEGIRLVVRHCVRHSDSRRLLAKFFGSMESLDTGEWRINSQLRKIGMQDLMHRDID